MAKSTSRKPTATVQVYNHTTRLLGCYVPVPKDAIGKARPPRQVVFKPGNNDEVPRVDYDLCMENEVFSANFTEREVLGRTGKKIKRRNLELGRTDEMQASEEDQLARKLDAARKDMAAQATG